MLAVAGTALAVASVGLHVAAGTGLPSDAARALSVQLPITAAGLLLAVHRPRNRLAPLTLVAGALLGLSLLSVAVLRYAASGSGVPQAAEHAAFAGVLLLGWPLTVVWVSALLAFPEGTPVPAEVRPWIGVAAVIHGAAAVGAYLTAAASDLPAYLHGLPVATGGGPFAAPRLHDAFAAANNVLLLALPAFGVAALVAWRRRSGPVARQQLKWLLPALALQLAVHLAVPTSADPWHGWRAAGELIVLGAPAVGCAAIAVAVFKYRLWEIDEVISKALVFALLSAVVTVVFVIVAFGAAVLVGGANGRVLTALAVVMMFAAASRRPRRRAEAAVRRLVYGERPRGFAVLGGLGDSLASADAAGDVADRIVDAIARGLSVPWAGVWLHVEDGDHPSLQLVAASGIGARSRPLSLQVAADLAAVPRASRVDGLPDPVAALVRSLSSDELVAVAPLVAGSDLIGLVACADRFREPIAEGDLELLGLLARDAALGLVNRRLETELRLRLEDLRRSRQRLVSAQDAERRKVERDLHDGAQAQLVALAARIRRLAATPAAVTADGLRALAGDAERALFGLQDLARGIYPSVLTDRGLVAAVRTQAARMPMDVQLSVEPGLAEARLPADVEAALYFVALEALGNAQKHAADARVRAAIRLDSRSRVVLEVSDDGPGFDTSASRGDGSGLVSMADRMEAIGGTLTVTSGAAHGSLVTAAVLVPEGWAPAATSSATQRGLS
jgi:signal transduction histidine kinase